MVFPFEYFLLTNGTQPELRLYEIVDNWRKPAQTQTDNMKHRSVKPRIFSRSVFSGERYLEIY